MAELSLISGSADAALSRREQPPKHCLLVVSTASAWPVTDGYSLRVFSLLRELSRNWAITLLAPRSSDPSVPPMPEGICDTIPLEISGRGLVYPWHFDQAPLRRALVEAVSRCRPDVALLWCGAEQAWLEEPGFPPAVGDRVDCFTLQFWQDAWSERTLKRFRWSLAEMIRSALHERRVGQALPTVVVGERDARVLERLTGRKAHVIPNGVDLPVSTTGEATRPTIAFTGVMDFPVNADTAIHAAKRIWPLVRNAVPDARFIIAGRNPVPEVQALRATPGIEILADVPDMAAVLKESWIAIAPMQTGTGIKNKVLEAWACARPVVMTPLATNGLRLPPGGEAFIAESPKDLARATIALLTDDKLRHAAGKAARSLVESEFTWARMADRLSQLLLVTAQGRVVTPP